MARKSRNTNSPKNLVVVESPAKARTMSAILGKEYHILASLGHVRDLPKSKLGVNVEEGFIPSYTILKSKRSVVKELKTLGETAECIYLATDPDREGEAISWHLVEAAGWDENSSNIRRVVFHEITNQGITEAFKHSRSLDKNLINSQQARRILDRLVGYQLSPLLWKKVQRGLSAGRVQSVALRFVTDREKEIGAFVPTEYWTISAELNFAGQHLTANLHSLKGQKSKIEIPDQNIAESLTSELRTKKYRVARVKNSEKKRRPPAPFTTSSLQQESWRKLKFSAKKTMLIAQQLYEGIPMGNKGAVGLITYMRTDSTNLATIAVSEAREYIKSQYGEKYLPKHPRIFKTKTTGAQEAHEAIRPTSISRMKDNIKDYLSRDQLLLYDLIWRRMLAGQMTDCVYDATTIEVEAYSDDSNIAYILRATGSVIKFKGFSTLYSEDDPEESKDADKLLPKVNESDNLSLLDIIPQQHFTQPPARYTEASLIKLLEEKGIGRPSTYVPILSTITDRNYVEKDKGRFYVTTLGLQVSDLLSEFFPDIMDGDFTANMEAQLDEIAKGEREWTPMLENFYTPFKETLEQATNKMPRVKIEKPTDEICDQCGGKMVIKTGRFGEFVACSGFPTCRNTKPILKRTGALCPKCGNDLVERRSKNKRRIFYGCSGFPLCKFSLLQRPIAQVCPECEGLMIAKGRDRAQCTTCDWQEDIKEPASNQSEVS